MSVLCVSGGGKLSQILVLAAIHEQKILERCMYLLLKKKSR
jgi:hypothetical protein